MKIVAILEKNLNMIQDTLAKELGGIFTLVKAYYEKVNREWKNRAKRWEAQWLLGSLQISYSDCNFRILLWVGVIECKS